MHQKPNVRCSASPSLKFNDKIRHKLVPQLSTVSRRNRWLSWCEAYCYNRASVTRRNKQRKWNENQRHTVIHETENYRGFSLLYRKLRALLKPQAISTETPTHMTVYSLRITRNYYMLINVTRKYHKHCKSQLNPSNLSNCRHSRIILPNEAFSKRRVAK